MKTIRRSSLLLACLLAAPLGAAPPKAGPAGEYIVYIGTYTGRQSQSKGIHAWRFDSATGKLAPLGVAAETPSPSFLAIHASGRFLYAVNEIGNFNGRRSGAVTAYSIDRETGRLTQLNQVSSKGSGPAHISLDRKGHYALVANYGSGSVAALPIGDDGKLGEASSVIQHEGKSVNPQRQERPHAHSINPAPDNRFAVVCDLGLDKVFVYRFDDTKGILSQHEAASVKPGAGPRHFAFHPNGKFGYVINEMASTVTAFDYDAKRGALKEIETVSTLPKDYHGDSTCAEVVVHPNGKFLYGSNRGHDSIAVFAISGKGTLTPIDYTPTQGKVPRNFALDPSGSYLFAANQNSGNVVIFRVDAKTGKLTPSGETIEIGSPVCVRFLKVK